MFIISEIGINWNGDEELLHKTIDAAKATGADAIKMQNYKTDKFVGQRSEFWEYENNGVKVKETQRDMFRRNEISFDQMMRVDKHCREIGIDWSATPMCREGCDELKALGVNWIKSGSDTLQDLPLIQYMGQTQLPTIISTGMAHISDIDQAVRCFRNTGNDNLTLLHCISSYPAPDDSINIQRIDTLRRTFGCPVGFSDHSIGITAAVLAVSQGATVIEKHFTLDKNLPGPDHSMSADPAEMTDLVKCVRQAEKQMGTPELGMTAIEAANRQKWFR